MTKGPEVWEVRSHPLFHHRDRMPSRELTLIVAPNVLDGTAKYFLSHGPAGTPITTLLRIALSRWRVERCFEDSKNEISRARAAEVLQISIHDRPALLDRHGIPWFDDQALEECGVDEDRSRPA